MASAVIAGVTKYVNDAYPCDFLKGMMTRRQNEQFIDVELESDSVNIPCHKVVLAAACPYFNTMFMSGMQESASRTVPLKVDSATLARVVDYLYTAEVEFTVDNVQGIIDASDLLQLDDLKAAGEKFMLEWIEPANCIGFYNYASLYRLKQLQEGAWRVMLDKFKYVVSTSEFKALSCQQLIDYLSDDEINVEDEDLVLESVLIWVKHDPDSRATFSSRILDHVRLPYCTINYLHQVVDTCDLFTPECREYVRDAIKCITQAAQRHEINSCRIVARRKFCIDQRLLVVGGRINLASKWMDYRFCHYLKEDSKSWELLAELPQTVGRSYCVCRIGSGLLLTGGIKDGARDDCWIFELANKNWEQMPPLNTARFFHSNVVMGDKVYVVGGFGVDNNVVKSVECLDVKRRQWSAVSDMPQPVFLPVAAGYYNDVYVFGGQNANNMSLCCARKYDTMGGEWHTLADMPEVCNRGSVVTLNSHMYVVGGHNRLCLRYDPAADCWTVLSKPRLEHGLAPAVVWRGRILVAGGFDANESTIEEYDPVTNLWSDWDIELKGKLSGHFLFNVDTPPPSQPFGENGYRVGKLQRMRRFDHLRLRNGPLV